MTVLPFYASNHTSAHDGLEGYKSINLWNLNTRDIIRTINVHDLVVSVKFSPDGNVVAGVGGINEPTLGLWDIHTGKIITTFCDTPVGLVYHSDLIYSIAFNSDGQMLASGSKDGDIKLSRIKETIDLS